MFSRSQQISLSIILALLAMLTTNVYGQELRLIVDSNHPLPMYLKGPYKLGADGNIYAGNFNGIVRITGTLEAEQIFTYGGQNSDITLFTPSTWTPSPGIRMESIADYEVDAAGTLYIAGTGSHNVVSIKTDGTINELISEDGDGKGNTLRYPKDLALDLEGNVYVLGLTPPSVFKIEPNGKTSLVLDETGVQGHAFQSPSKIVIDSANNKYVGSSSAIFKIPSFGETTVHLDFNPDLDLHKGVTHLQVDDFGNLYFIKGSGYSELYRYSVSNGLERVLGLEGDGTGEIECLKQGDREHDPWICTGYGNYSDLIVGTHIDDAQNIYIASRESRKIFRVTPTNLVSEVADLSTIENFNFERLDSFMMDSVGNLYLVHSKVSGSGISIFSYSPFAVESQDDFNLDAPHSRVAHNSNGVTSTLPSSYTFTSLSQENKLPDTLAHLDTRTEAFANLPWQDASTTTTNSADPFSETTRTSLTFEGHRYVAEMLTSIDKLEGKRWINSIAYFVDGEQSYMLNGLNIPLDTYYDYMNQSLMRWLYLGNDVISGGPRADILLGYEGHDILYGNGGDDLMDGSSGSNVYYGGDGVDTVVYEKNHVDYMLSKNPVTGTVSVQVKTGFGSPYVDQVAPDIEWLRFHDMEISTATLSYWGELKPIQNVQTEKDPVTVYRFFNTKNKAFFYTINPDERTMVLRNSGPNNKSEVDWPYVYQGAQFQAAHSYAGAVPLYRFYNTKTGHHFFTNNENERAQILGKIGNADWPYIDEGIAFNVYAQDPTPNEVGNEKAVHRYYSPSLDRHFFTANEDEAAMLNVSEDWTYEGIGFYAEGVQNINSTNVNK